MEKLISIKQGPIAIEGMLKIPSQATGLVLFAHGSGSSRFSPRNNFVANILNENGLATLLIDLLSHQEDEVYQTRFDIDLLAERLNSVVEWLQKHADTKDLAIGLFGASTGAAATLQVAAARGADIKAVVSRGGRPDLAMPYLDQVVAPTLLIVGGNDFEVIKLNKAAYDRLVCTKKIEIVPHATHLFEEPGCLDAAAALANNWFKTYFTLVA